MDIKERNQIEEEFDAAIKRNEQLWEWADRLDRGYGTYEDVEKIAEIVGDELGKTVTEETTEEILRVVAERSHELINGACELAQSNLNNAADIGIKAQTTKFPESKFEDVLTALAGANDVSSAAGVICTTFAMTMADDIIKYNMDFQAKSGLEPIIKRTWSGKYPTHDTKHWDDCKKLAGEWTYGTEPKMTYARHQGCRCIVEFFPTKRAQGRITALAAGEVDYKDGILWNTRPETMERRMQNAEKRRSQYKAKQTAGKKK